MNPPTRPSIAVCPGSYDPITHGHLDVITRAAEIFDEIIVAVVNLSTRKNNPLFGIEERLAFIADATAGLTNVRTEPFDVLVVDFARRNGARTIVKGLRAISDFEYEFEMNQLNRHQAPDIDTLYLMASPKYLFPQLQRCQGAGHVRGGRRGVRPHRCGPEVEGRAGEVTN